MGISGHTHLRWLKKKLLLSLILHHMQKTKFITQLILKIKLTHYLPSLWACPSMPYHTNLKQPTNICFFHGLLVISKSSTSTYLRDFLPKKILHSDWPWGFWTIIQETDFSQTCCFCKKLKDLWYFRVKAKKHIYISLDQLRRLYNSSTISPLSL